MLKSMTGFGLCRFQCDEFEVEIEIKSLNSKFLDVSLRMSSLFSDKEAEIRSVLQQQLERGKVFFSLIFKDKTNRINLLDLNAELASSYYQKFAQLADSLSAPKQDLLRFVLSQPEVLGKKNDEQVFETHWQTILDHIHKALNECNEFRAQEGKKMGEKILENLDKIILSLNLIESFEPHRIEKLKAKLLTQITEIQSFNPERLEQELIYYIEKLDIYEEKVRLKNHIDYFRKNMNESSGRKLGFIAQEIGREINTIGSKASDSNIQKLVVEMKDELEKIKEQLGNVL